jgi:APA family basic amino acid/polyamine antiporter
MSVAATEPTPKLVRELGALDATMIVVGTMIGSGIFITSAESSRFVGAPGWLLMAWALAGLLTVTGALCCSELAAMMPQAGGQYVFLREAYGPAVGFLFGWSTFLVVQTGTIAAVAVAFAKFLGVLTPDVSADRYLVAPIELGASGYALSLSTQQLVGIAVIAVLTVTNLFGLKTGKWIQNVLTITKTGALLALIAVGLTIGMNREAAAWTASWWNPSANGWTAERAQKGLGAFGSLALVLLLGRAMIGPLFSQTAWNNVTFTGGEVRDPRRTLPRALVFGCATVVVLYLLANVAYLVTLPFDGIRYAPEDRVGTALMDAIFGRPGQIAMAVAILISTFGCDNGLILAGARVYYAMARDGLFFRRIGTTNRRHVPAVALITQGVWASLLTLPRTVTRPQGGPPVYQNLYNQLLEFVICTDVSFYALMVGAVLVLRWKRPDAERPYRTFGYPWTPILYLIVAIALFIDLVYLTPRTAGIGYLIVLTGLPVYLIWSRGSRPQRTGAHVG